MQKFETFLESISKRPAMYVGNCSISLVGHFLRGYAHALHDIDPANAPFAGWTSWVELRFLIHHSAWDWTRILLHAYGSDQTAIAALPSLYREFCAQHSVMGVGWIESELRRQLVERYGRDWHEPDVTDTKPYFYPRWEDENLWSGSEALEFVESRMNEDWTEDLSGLLKQADPNGESPEPRVMLASARYLLSKQTLLEIVRQKLSAMSSRDLGDAALLALEYLPDLALTLFRRALRSSIPNDRTTAAAALAIIDQPWSRAELLAILRESTDEEATSECRAALSTMPDMELKQAVEQWQTQNPHQNWPKQHHPLREVFLETRNVRLQREIETLRGRVLPLRSTKVDVK